MQKETFYLESRKTIWVYFLFLQYEKNIPKTYSNLHIATALNTYV